MKELFNKMKKLTKILYYIYLFLYIFLMINREFLFFGIDLRFVLLPIGVFLILFELYNRKHNKRYYKEKYFDKDFKLIFLFFIWVFISNISWLWNGLEMNKYKFINEMILLINNFIGIIVFYLYKQYLDRTVLNKVIVFSSLILVLSFALLGLGYNMTEISGANEESIYVATEASPDHINIFGKGYRIGGYAQDPNYASIFLIIAIISALQLDIKKIYKIIVIGIFTVALGFSASKTILLASTLGMIYIAINKITKPNFIKKLNIILLIGIICIILIILNLNILKSLFPSTMTTRFAMWKEANILFKTSPIIGNGITSFRSYFAINHWYVQTHSTYMQLLSETGIIGLTLFLKIMYNNLNKKNLYNKFLLVVYLIFAINFETIALQFFVYIIYLMNIEKKDIPIAKKALFMVNTLSNGGAEKVCINMANELIKQNYKVDFILLNNNATYNIDPQINIYDLKINDNNRIKKILKLIKYRKKIDEIILENERETRYSLITSHLPMSNLLTRFSVVRNRAIYVLHTTMKFYDKNNNPLFKLALKYIFYKKKLVTVSKGLEKECKKGYNMNYCNIRTIYNPLNIEEINEKKNEKVEVERPYILQVGRFSKEKRQDRMIEIFYRGKLYMDYQLIFCGSGETENTIKEKVENLGIQDKVTFLGWQDNIYKWMKNCKVLVCTSDIEAFPMTLIEAMVCNAKVVSSDCEYGPNEILIDEYSIFLVKQDDITEYIEKINNALEEYPDFKNPIIEKCDSKNVIKEYIDFME